MGEFLNHYSFLMTMVFLWALAAWQLLRKDRNQQRWLVFGGITVVLLLGYLVLRPAQATNADAEGIRAQIGAGQPVLLEFQSRNCMGCVAAKPIVEGLEKELAGKLVVLRVDVDSPAGRALTKQYGSRVTPTFIFFTPEGEEAWRQFGGLDANKVRASLP